MKGIRDRLQHRFNPLHIYCRLRMFGLSAPFAQRVCFAYERIVYRRTLS